MNLSEEKIWTILKSYFDENSIAKDHLDSYNDFIKFGMQRIIDQEGNISINGVDIKYGQIFIDYPSIVEENRTTTPIFPNEARLKDLSYDSPIICNITISENGKSKTIQEVIGRIPVMLKSCICNLSKLTKSELIQKKECITDYGGYFIIKGTERMLVSQLRGNYNTIFVTKQKESKYAYLAEIRSISEETGHSVLIQAMMDNNGKNICFSLPYIKEKIPVGIVFKAFSVDLKDLFTIFPENFHKYIKYIIRDAGFINSQEEALDYIKKIHKNDDEKSNEFTKQILESELFPHLGISSSIKSYVFSLIDMVKKLISTFLQLRSEDDRDNYSNKRVEISGILIHDIFRNLFKKYITIIKEQLKNKKYPDPTFIVNKTKTISKNLYQCFATGNWGVQKNAYMRAGVSQVYDRMTYSSSISHYKRINIPMGKEGKNCPIRQIHPSSFGFICPCETPEGQKVGVVLNYAMLTQITKKIQTVDVRNILELSLCKKSNCILFIKDSTPLISYKYTRVFLNGILLGFSENFEDFIENFKSLRDKGVIHKQVSITYDDIDDEIRMYCDEGRLIRPLFVVKNLKEVLKKNNLNWNYLIDKNIIRYVDASEIENSLIAMNIDKLKENEYDYLEIHPYTMLGLVASMIPFPDHSQAPRNCFQSAMGKQALGISLYTFNNRADTTMHVLHYAQKPLVSNKIHSFLNLENNPCGVNAIVAVISYEKNQEDSIIISQRAVDSGMFTITTYFTIQCSEKRRCANSIETICKPPENSASFKRKNANYSLLDENGIVRSKVGMIDKNGVVDYTKGNCMKVVKGDVLIGKIITTFDKDGEEKKKDSSVVVQSGEEGYIDKIYSLTTPDNYKLIKIVIRNTRSPMVGDKLAANTGQKATIGKICSIEDMPFTSAGMIPDLIINSCCLPSKLIFVYTFCSEKGFSNKSLVE
jgi:DNA-directed RNA polymerase II subunit RPB2